ncbi:hypothetical protein QE152_g4434 [Popillia japonica]|uniref:Uncharacterized protein n=1 Tax=Popillia japonica TaxID=7064 RepID=A0AAW1N0S9_POPJA
MSRKRFITLEEALEYAFSEDIERDILLLPPEVDDLTTKNLQMMRKWVHRLLQIHQEKCLLKNLKKLRCPMNLREAIHRKKLLSLYTIAKMTLHCRQSNAQSGQRRLIGKI